MFQQENVYAVLLTLILHSYLNVATINVIDIFSVSCLTAVTFPVLLCNENKNKTSIAPELRVATNHIH